MNITLKTLTKAKTQEVFDFIATHLLKQKKQSRLKRRCFYRSRQGAKTLKCAAGCLIADDEYKEEFEGVDWNGLVQDHGIPKANNRLISLLQHIHDSSWPEKWFIKLHDLARAERLNTDCLNKFNKYGKNHTQNTSPRHRSAGL